MTEQELKLLDLLGFPCETCTGGDCAECKQGAVEGIKEWMKQAGYVQITREEAEHAVQLIGNRCSLCQSITAKLRERLERDA